MVVHKAMIHIVIIIIIIIFVIGLIIIFTGQQQQQLLLLLLSRWWWWWWWWRQTMLEADVIIRDSVSTSMEDAVRHFIKLSTLIVSIRHPLSLPTPSFPPRLYLGFLYGLPFRTLISLYFNMKIRTIVQTSKYILKRNI